jgi:signal transduction histidine kinase
MAQKRASARAQVEERILALWKHYAGRQVGGADRVAAGSCYLGSRPCPFEARPTFEARFVEDCVHCARLQGAVERLAPAPPGASGVLPTLELLVRLTEESGSATPAEDVRYRTAAILFRSLPLIHGALDADRIARLLLAGIATGFGDSVDTLLFLRVTPDGAGLTLTASFRSADLDGPLPAVTSVLDLEAIEAGHGLDGEVFDRLREEVLPIDSDRDLLSDAVLDGRTTVVPDPQREIRLPTVLVDHLPPGPAVILPVFGRDRVLGLVLVAASSGVTGWDADQMELLGAITAQAGIALEATSLLDLARRRGAALPALLAALRLLPQAGEPRRRAEVALGALRSATYAAGGVAWSRESDDAFEVAAVTGVDSTGTADFSAAGASLLQWLTADPRPIVMASLEEDPRLQGTVPPEWRTALAAPLLSGDSVSGAVLVFDKAGLAPGHEPRPFDAEDAQVAETLTRLVSLALDHGAHGEALRLRDRRIEELESQLRHAEKLAVVGERGLQIVQDVRTPVSAIIGFARRILRTMPEGDQNREFIEVIRKESERIDRVLGEQTALAQLTQPRLKLENLNALVQGSLEAQSEDLVRRRVRLLKRLAPDIPQLLLDGAKMRQVLQNVLSYALQSVPSGGRVRVETRQAPGAAQVEIAHDGPRTAGEVLDRLFVPFTTSRRSGAGIGLAMAYQIVREHGGEIRARSEGDWTSIVTIYLPIRENQDRRKKPDRRAGRADRRRRLA